MVTPTRPMGAGSVPLVRLSPSVCWVGVLPRALGWVRGMQWGRSPLETHRHPLAWWTRGVQLL